MLYAGGVDVGSTQTKAIVVDEEGRIVGRSLMPTGANVVLIAVEAFSAALEQGGIAEEDVKYVIGTGYGRYRVEFGDDQASTPSEFAHWHNIRPTPPAAACINIVSPAFTR